MQRLRLKNHFLRSSYSSTLLTKNTLIRNDLRNLTTTQHCHDNKNNNKWNPVVRQRNADLGRHVFEAYAVRTLIDQHPDLNAGEIHDITQGLLRSEMIVDKMQVQESEDLFNQLGQLQLRKDVGGDLDQLLSEVGRNIFESLSSVEKDFLMKFQHPKFILKRICEVKGLSPLLVEMLHDTAVGEGGIRECEFRVTCGEQVFELRIPAGNNSSYTRLEQDASLAFLNEHFSTEFNSFNFLLSDVTIAEEEILLNPKLPVKREVVLSTIRDDFVNGSFTIGITIRGGERKVIRDGEFIQRHINTPVFISHVTKGSVAERCGLIAGDVLLGIGEHSLTEVTHKEAVTALKRHAAVLESGGSSGIVFTVKHSPEVKLKYEAEARYLERQKEKVREEVNNRMTTGRWHDAKAKLDPEQYVMEKLVEKKRPFTVKKIRKSRRLWDN